MPSEKALQQKQQVVAQLIEKIKSSVAGVLVDYKGISVEDDTKLRRELREANVDYAVVKNTLLRLAAKETGLEELNSVLEGATALAVSKDDQMAPARILFKYSEAIKGDVFTIKAGFMDGKVVDTKTVEAIAKIPAKEVLLSQMLSSLNAPIANLAVVLNQIAEKKSA